MKIFFRVIQKNNLFFTDVVSGFGNKIKFPYKHDIAGPPSSFIVFREDVR